MKLTAWIGVLEVIERGASDGRNPKADGLSGRAAIWGLADGGCGARLELEVAKIVVHLWCIGVISLLSGNAFQEGELKLPR